MWLLCSVSIVCLGLVDDEGWDAWAALLLCCEAWWWVLFGLCAGWWDLLGIGWLVGVVVSGFG